MDTEKIDGMFTITDSDDEGEFDDVEVGEDKSSPPESISRGPPKSKSRRISCIIAIGSIVMAATVVALALQGGYRTVHGNESDSLSGQERVEVELPSRAKTAVALTDNKDTGEGNKVKEQWYVSPPTDPIPVSIRLIDQSIMEPYPAGDEGCEALTADIYNASAIIANEVIKRNARYWYRRRRYRYGVGADMRSSISPSPKKDGNVGGKGKGEDAYGTNNQETGVDEADIIKSGGKHVFTGYGDILVVWDAITMSRTTMPERKVLTREEGYDLQRKARIAGLLLDSSSNRLVVIVSGYSSRYRYDDPLQPVLSDRGDTRLHLYDIATLSHGSELLLISSEEMDGVYSSARKVDGVAHIVHPSDVNTDSHISLPLRRYHNDFWRDSKEMYIANATTKAKMLLPTFAQRLTEELKAISGGSSDCSTVTRVALFASVDDKNQDDFPDSVASAILRSYLQVSSFQIAPSPQKGEGSLALNTMGSFFPSTNSEIYSSEDVLVVAGRGYHHDAVTLSWGQSTYFLAYKLHSDGSAPTGLGLSSVPGYLLNQFSMDEYKGYFRVATTERSRWTCIPIDPSTVSRHPYYWPRCKWERASESKSQLAVLKFPLEYGEMKLIKVITNLGVTEEIKSVRFFDDKAYLVTFMRTDPLYTIDFSDAENPIVTDELKISGFSSYLHPVGNNRLLAIGKEANETTGRVTGFQITLFDVSDLHNAAVLQRHTIKQRWARSSAEGDHLAFRYLPLSKTLILPISVRTYRSTHNERNVTDFDGFKVFSVSDEEIENRFSISMTTSSRMSHGCWYHAYLPPRSMVFSGNLTIIKGHGYMSYDLDTEEMRWKHNLDQNVTKDQCSRYWE